MVYSAIPVPYSDSLNPLGKWSEALLFWSKRPQKKKRLTRSGCLRRGAIMLS